MDSRPLLMVDIDGVVSLFGAPDASPGREMPTAPPAGGAIEGAFHSIEGIPHFLSSTAAAHLLALAALFELVWASGWEEKANEHLPHLLGLPRSLPFLRFARGGGGRGTQAHWKLESVEAYAGDRPLAWVDDAFNPACHAWAQARREPTLLVTTRPEQGLTSREAELLVRWAQGIHPG
jgi:HAD domain in Swiss Army Knife RNA repair proteins